MKKLRTLSLFSFFIIYAFSFYHTANAMNQDKEDTEISSIGAGISKITISNNEKNTTNLSEEFNPNPNAWYKVINKQRLIENESKGAFLDASEGPSSLYCSSFSFNNGYTQWGFESSGDGFFYIVNRRHKERGTDSFMEAYNGGVHLVSGPIDEKYTIVPLYSFQKQYTNPNLIKAMPGQLLVFCEGEDLYCKVNGKEKIKIGKASNEDNIGINSSSFDRITQALKKEMITVNGEIVEKIPHNTLGVMTSGVFPITKKDTFSLLKFTTSLGYTKSKRVKWKFEKDENKDEISSQFYFIKSEAGNYLSVNFKGNIELLNKKDEIDIYNDNIRWLFLK